MNIMEVEPAAVPMTQAGVGVEMVITEMTDVGADALRLLELGFYRGHPIKVLMRSDPMVCQLDQARVGLTRRLAQRIQVQPRPAPMP